MNAFTAHQADVETWQWMTLEMMSHFGSSREGWRGQRYHWPLKGGLVEPGRQCSGAMVVTEREL